MAHGHAQAEAAWIRLLVPVNASRARLWVLGLLLAGWICFLLAMYFLTVAQRPANGTTIPSGAMMAAATWW